MNVTSPCEVSVAEGVGYEVARVGRFLAGLLGGSGDPSLCLLDAPVTGCSGIAFRASWGSEHPEIGSVRSTPTDRITPVADHRLCFVRLRRLRRTDPHVTGGQPQ